MSEAEIRAAREAAPEYVPGDDPGKDDAEIARLAALPRLAYDREREDAAKRLGCRAPTLDKLVAARRGDSTADTGGEGRSLGLADFEPWPDPVDGADLLDDLARTIRRHVVLDQAAADAAALWIVHTHAIDAAYVSPRLAITSPEKRCGKTTLLTVLGALVARSLATANMTTATIFRVIQAARPTLLIDEADSFLSDAEEMRGVINAGHCRANATVLRTVETPQSPDGYEVRKFAVWGAMALAAIGRLPGTIEDRAIKIAMRRRRPDEAVERLRLDRLAGLTPLARRAARWVADHAVALAAADPDTPAELHDRAADNWRALLAIADAAGGGWSARARSAAVTLTREGADDGETARTMLLSDIRAAFIAKGVDRIASEDLVACLASLDDRPWPEYRAGKPITKVQLARLLKPLKISSGTIRLDDGKTPKGYYRRAFEDAFVRYLPAERNATTPQGKDSATFSQNQSATSGGGVAFPNPQNPSVSAACGVVVVREPQTGNDEDYEERAAILEYEAGMSRADAERCAYVAV